MFDDLEDPCYTNNRSLGNQGQTTKEANQRKPKTMSIQVIEGTLNFSNLTKTDSYMGQDTGKYNVTITLDEKDANRLSGLGVKVKEYQGMSQRKFASKYSVLVIDNNGERYNGEIPYNSRVRVKFKLGNPHPVHGVSTYLNAVKVLEEAEIEEAVSDF